MKGLEEMTGNYKGKKLKTISLKEFLDKYYETENTEILDRGIKIIDKQIRAIVPKVLEIRGQKSFIELKLTGRKKLKGAELRKHKNGIISLEKRKNKLSKEESSFLDTTSKLKGIRRAISEKSYNLKESKKNLSPKRGGIKGYSGWLTEYISDYDLNRDEG